MRLRTLIAATAATALIAGAGAAHAEEMKLKAGFFIAAKKSLFRQAFDKFVERVNSQCEGQVEISQVLSAEAVPSRQIPNALKRGVIDVAGAPPSYFSGLVPGSAGYTAPRVDAATQRENGAYELADSALRERGNAHLLAQYGFGVRFHIFTSKPVKSIDDFKGMKLRTSNTYKAFFDALGAQPISMSRREIFTAMERGVVGGFANLNSEVEALGLGEVVKYRIDPSFYDTIVWIAINQDTWNKMSDAQKDCMSKAGLWQETSVNKWIADQDVSIGEKQAKGTYEVIKLPEAEAEKYVDMAYKAIWDTIEKRAPDMGAKARKLLKADQ